MCTIIFIILTLTSLSQAAHPLVQISEIIEKELTLYIKDGQLMILSPSSLSAYYPFRETVQQFAPKPNNLDGWTMIDSDCSDKQDEITVDYSDTKGTYNAIARRGKDGLHIFWKQEDVLLAEQLIVQQATPCAIHIQDIDKTPGLELIVAWQFGLSLNGFTIYKVPETAY